MLIKNVPDNFALAKVLKHFDFKQETIEVHKFPITVIIQEGSSWYFISRDAPYSRSTVWEWETFNKNYS